jgi:hypothetical protein
MRKAKFIVSAVVLLLLLAGNVLKGDEQNPCDILWHYGKFKIIKEKFLDGDTMNILVSEAYQAMTSSQKQKFAECIYILYPDQVVLVRSANSGKRLMRISSEGKMKIY